MEATTCFNHTVTRYQSLLERRERRPSESVRK
jgi:hypothetical protein